MGRKKEICQQILSGQLNFSFDEFGRPVELLPLLTHRYILYCFSGYLCEKTAGTAAYACCCRLHGCIINVNCEVFHAGLCKMEETWAKMDFIPLKAPTNPDTCVNKPYWLSVDICVYSFMLCTCMYSYTFLSTYIHMSFGGELSGIADSFKLICICLGKKYSLCIHIQ